MTRTLTQPARPNFHAMFKRSSYWPANRRLFRGKGSRSVAATLLVLVLSVAAAALLVSVLRQPGL